MSDKVIRRQEAILDYLKNWPVLSVQLLAAKFGVSIETMRKDLAVLAQRDLVMRVHGGVSLSRSLSDVSQNMLKLHRSAKQTVAELAVSLVKPQASILIEDGSTCYAFAEALVQGDPALLSGLTIITNSFLVCNLFELGSRCKNLFFLGGLCNQGRQATGGHSAAQQLSSYHIQQMFIAPAGISPALNVVAWSDSDAAFQTEALRCADEKILMADSSKFLSNDLLNVAPLSAFDRIVTDLTPEDPIHRNLLRHGLPVLIPTAPLDSTLHLPYTEKVPAPGSAQE